MVIHPKKAVRDVIQYEQSKPINKKGRHIAGLRINFNKILMFDHFDCGKHQVILQ